MLKNILLATASTLLALLVAESALHLLAPTGLIPGRVIGTFADNNIPRSNAEPGLPRMMAGNAMGTSQYYCYRTPLRTNEIGFHDIQWPENLKGGIALIGDSFVRAEQVPISSTTASLLRNRLQVPVISVGSNTLGTFGEQRLYETYVRPLQPSTVLLFFFLGNDMADNNCATNKASRCGTMEKGGSIVANNNDTQIETGPGNDFWSKAKRYCFLCNVFAYTFDRYVPKDSTKENRIQEDSWHITEHALVAFRDEVEKDGGRFIVVIVPEVDIPYRSILTKETRLLALTESLRLETLNLRPAFAAYAEAFTLGDPFLSFWCDGHWNPAGHYVAAAAIADFLQDSSSQELLSPQSLLGESAWAAIYRHGIYAPTLSD